MDSSFLVKVGWFKLFLIQRRTNSGINVTLHGEGGEVINQVYNACICVIYFEFG